MEEVRSILSFMLNHPYFDTIAGMIAVINPIVLLPQLIDVIKKQDVSGINVPMFYLFMVIQGSFGLVSVKADNPLMFIAMIASMIISLAIALVVSRKRKIAKNK